MNNIKITANDNFKKNKKNNNNNVNNVNNMNNENGVNSKYNKNDTINSIVKDSLDYYDKHQPQIQQILNKIEYIKIDIGKNVNDEYIFYDSNDKIIFKSKIETLSLFIPHSNIWKWSWSVPFAKYNNTLISREILKYAFTLNSENDFFLKSILINSKNIIKNQYQLDIYLALSSLLSKKPFILRIYLVPPDDHDDNNNIDNNKNSFNNEFLYEYKKILKNPDKKNYISVFVLVVDWPFI